MADTLSATQVMYIVGEVLEWPNRRAWRARVPSNRDRGFESHPLRHNNPRLGTTQRYPKFVNHLGITSKSEPAELVALGNKHIRGVSIIGAGLMGHGIAIEFAIAGYDVRLHSRSEQSLDRARGMIGESLQRLRELGSVSGEQAELAPACIRMSTDLTEMVEDADLVIESIYEDIDAKTEIFRQLDKLCPDRTILASNTSSLLPSSIAAATTRPDKVINTHFLNPPLFVPLVEVIPTAQTSEETTSVIMELLTSLGKQPLLVKREAPGFVVNRLQMALLREALWLVENGVASAEDVDKAISAGLGRRWATTGVLQVLEAAGWDLISRVASDVFPQLSNSDDPSLLHDMVERGYSGLKAGKGFYEWTPEKAEELRRRIAKGLVEIDKLD